MTGRVAFYYAMEYNFVLLGINIPFFFRGIGERK
jgi:hypothetical protein